MKYKHISLVLSLALTAQLITPVLASDLSAPDTQATAIIPANIQATTLSVTVPTQLPIQVSSDGTHTYSTDAHIQNKSSGPVIVSNIQMEPQNNWVIESYDTDMSKEPVGTEKIGFSINNSKTVAESNQLTDIASNFGMIAAGDKQLLNYSAAVPPQAKAISDLSISKVIFTVDWYTGGNNSTENEKGLLALDKETVLMLPGTKEEIQSTYLETPSIVALMALDSNIEWKSSNTDIAVVSNGIVEAKSTGAAVITAQVGELTATCNIIVNEPWIPITAISFSKSNTTIVNGSSETVLLMYNPEKFSGTTNLEVSSSDTSIASVTPTSLNGVSASDGPTPIQITGVAPGKATITATITTGSGTITDTIAVTVTKPLKGIEISGPTEVKVGEVIRLIANKIPADTTDTNTITWSSADNGVATVDKDGKVTGVAVGSTTITALCSGLKSIYNIDVIEAVPPLNATSIIDKNKMNTALLSLTGTITFSTESPSNKVGTDISEAGDKSIIAVINGQDATIYAEGGSLAPANSSSMFRTYKAKSLDLRGLDTSNVTSMLYMFYTLPNLNALNLSSFDTSKVENMCYMFSDCYALDTVELGSFDTSNVTDMSYMFSDCYALDTVELGSFDTSNVTDMTSMFTNCPEIHTLDLSNFNTSNVTDMTNMFKDCIKLTTINLSRFNTSNVNSMSSMFSNCPLITTLDLSSFDTSNVTNVRSIFGGCDRLKTVYAKTQADADKLNSSAFKPASLKVTVKVA